MKRIFVIGSLLFTICVSAQPYSRQIAATVMNTWKDSFALEGRPARWSYDMGVILKGFEGTWRNSGEVKYFNYILKQMDFFVKAHQLLCAARLFGLIGTNTGIASLQVYLPRICHDI